MNKHFLESSLKRTERLSTVNVSDGEHQVFVPIHVMILERLDMISHSLSDIVLMMLSCFELEWKRGVAWHDDMTRTGARRRAFCFPFQSLLFRKASYSTHNNTTLNKILKCFNNEISFRLFPISSGFNCDFDSFSCRKLFPSSPFNCVRFSIEQFSWINKNLWQACREFSISFHSSYVVLPLLSPPNKRCHRIWWLKLFLFAFESTLLPSLLYIQPLLSISCHLHSYNVNHPFSYFFRS